eukprot:scaffold158317_cov28-Tisochrysis_lutea.AAC.4
MPTTMPRPACELTSLAAATQTHRTLAGRSTARYRATSPRSHTPLSRPMSTLPMARAAHRSRPHARTSQGGRHMT